MQGLRRALGQLDRSQAALVSLLALAGYGPAEAAAGITRLRPVGYLFLVATLGQSGLGLRRRATLLVALAAVAAGAIVALATGETTNRAAAATSWTAKAAGPQLRPPGHGMAGQVQVLAAAFPTAEHGVVLVEQSKTGRATSGTYHDWVVVTDNAGRSWTVRRAPLIPAYHYPGMVFANAKDGWTEGGYVTHDGGLTWHKARIPEHLLSVESVSIGGGRVWALTQQDGPHLQPVVLTGPAAGNRLVRAATQQDASAWIVAGSTSTTYVTNGALYHPPSTATDDGGRSWHNLAALCPPGHAAATGLPGAFHADLLQICSATHLVHGVPKLNPDDHSQLISRSTDGGLRWAAYPNPKLVDEPRPVTARTAWATCDSRDLCRSTDGGITWRYVWTQPARPSDSFPAALTAPGPLDAEEVADVSPPTGTYLILYATTDGGQRWRSTIVPLPTG